MYKYPNLIMSFLVGRTQTDLAKSLNITKACFNSWTKGIRFPNKYIMPELLKLLGEPWGRTLELKEVWPTMEEKTK